MENDTMRAELVRTLGAGATLEFEDETYNVIFDNEYVLAGDVEERAPTAWLLTSEVAAAELAKGDEVEVHNPLDGTDKNYVVRRIEHDGTGMTRLVMGQFVEPEEPEDP